MPCFPRLRSVESYRPAIFDLTSDQAARRHWLEIFRLNLLDIERIVHEHRNGFDARNIDEVREEFFAFLGEMDESPDPLLPDVHTWSMVRDRLLKKHSLPDPYLEVKEIENRKALALLPGVLSRIEAVTDPEARLREIVSHIFAGNMFDLGSAVTAKAHREKGLEFESLLERNRGKEWFIDHMDALFDWLGRSGGRRGSSVLFLADNAGPDFLCGCLPFAMELSSYVDQVHVGLNEFPALNDVTFEEGRALLQEVCGLSKRCGKLVEAGRLSLLSTGSSTAGIDLRSVSREMAELGETIDLFILEGQGRAVETNWNAVFDVDCLRISTIKDSEVARYLGASVYDMVFRFEEACRA